MAAFSRQTFHEAAAQADALAVANIEGSSTQGVSMQIQKPLDPQMLLSNLASVSA